MLRSGYVSFAYWMGLLHCACIWMAVYFRRTEMPLEEDKVRHSHECSSISPHLHRDLATSAPGPRHIGTGTSPLRDRRTEPKHVPTDPRANTIVYCSPAQQRGPYAVGAQAISGALLLFVPYVMHFARASSWLGPIATFLWNTLVRIAAILAANWITRKTELCRSSSFIQ